MLQIKRTGNNNLLGTQKYFSLGLSLSLEALPKISLIPYHILGWLTAFQVLTQLNKYKGRTK
jgi:hypothetical protein